MPNPGKSNRNYAHPPTDAQRFHIRHPPDPAKQRTPNRSTQSPVIVPSPYPLPNQSVEHGNPQPLIPESETKRKLRERRQAERRERNAKENAA